ncbi:Bromodomain-containing protein [Delitschia confertaspora ATCC 74209]|uniref:Bromodomain-containing protein n=1 Tax=Delitschia confertaspora ATCC 74209 TaxID=1513339 RepID=A0A9P4MX64_9PLEO|nr:Bromodomain-containing protein [Delitschia confertaspora ATCC 74209]
MGLRFIESLRAAKDKTGRPIATHFLTLPDRHQYPEYYEAIKLPIAFDTIEDKLNRGEYSNLSQVESDCKRLVNNAKAYNDKKSLIYEDAERVRKTASNFMVKHNPAYRDGNYVAVATPIPGEEPHGPGRPIPRVVPPSKVVPPTPTPDERPRRAAAAAQSSTPAPSRLRQPIATPIATPAPKHESTSAPKQDPSSEYFGLTFQQAQEKLIRDMIEYVDPKSNLQIFFPFVNLPSRSLRDYYQLIKHPMSLQGVQKKVRGVVGRNAPTGVTDLKSWDALENEVSFIWRNAREYNEDGSDIFNLSIEFEALFKQKLAEIKAAVEEPPQPKLRLNMSAPPKQPSIKLRLGHRTTSPALNSDPNTPSARKSATPGVIIDNEALQRQQRHIQDSINGARQPSAGPSQTPMTGRNPFTGPKSSVPPSNHAASPPAVNGVKSDPQSMQSPALSSIRPASTSSDAHIQRMSVAVGTPSAAMPPPPVISRPASGSPLPNGTTIPQAGIYHQHPPPNYYAPPPVTNHPDDYRKTPLKSNLEALMPKITVSTHPGLNLPKPYSVVIPADKEKSTYSVTLPLPSTHSYLQITPYIPIALSPRLYRIFVSVNNMKTMEVNRPPVIVPQAGINGTPTMGYETKKKGEPVYEAKLVPGVNRIEVEIVAEKDPKDRASQTGGANGRSTDPKDIIEVEKCTIFANLMRPY